jgi:hypothetical protein
MELSQEVHAWDNRVDGEFYGRTGRVVDIGGTAC